MEIASEQSSVLFFPKSILYMCWERFYQPLASQNLTLTCCQVTHTITLSIQFHSEMWPDKTLQIWIEIPMPVMGVRCCAKHIAGGTKALMNDGVARPAVPPNICLYEYFFDKKKEKIKICVCVCVHKLKRRKEGNGHHSEGNSRIENWSSPFTAFE